MILLTKVGYVHQTSEVYYKIWIIIIRVNIICFLAKSLIVSTK